MPTRSVKRLLSARHARLPGRVALVLAGVFLLAGAFYVWIAATSLPMSLHDGLGDRYNLLATAFIHLRLSVGRAPAALMHLADPYNPELNGAAIAGSSPATSLNDDVLFHGQLYFVWGPAPALVLLVPLRLLGFEPSASVTVAVYSIVGLGFALAILKLLIEQVGEVPTWMCAIAALTLALSSAIPFILRTPGVTEDALAGGYCFTMAGIWLAASALRGGTASMPRLVLMSLCFGLAAGSRPALALVALILIPVYRRLRAGRSRRSLAMALGLPLAVCVALLLAYNQARFHTPFEVGSRYQLTAYDSRDAPLGRLSYVLPGSLPYFVNPPQPIILFPFIALVQPPTHVPAGMGAPEVTGGLLPMTPLVVFVAALPWIWRRRSSLLGALAAPLIVLAGVGFALIAIAAYQLFALTERYEVDFATLFVLGALAAWLSLSKGPLVRRRRLARAGGGVLAAWGCIAGIAASFFGYGDALAVEHPGTWRALEEAGSPLSRAIVDTIGHPVLAASFRRLDLGANEFFLSPGGQEGVTIVSPGARTATLSASVEMVRGGHYGLEVAGPGNERSRYPLPAGGGTVELPVRLHGGVNRLLLHPLAHSPAERAATGLILHFSELSLGPGS